MPERQNYTIHANIKGWGCSSDGAGVENTPVVEGQLRALRKAYDRAGIFNIYGRPH